jgi:hypothetical protein
MIPEILQKGGEGGIDRFSPDFHPKSEPPNTRSRKGPNFIFRRDSKGDLPPVVATAQALELARNQKPEAEN